MGKRAGNFVTLSEVLDEVGVDATRWFLVSRSADATMEFDLDLAAKQSIGEPGVLRPVRARAAGAVCCADARPSTGSRATWRC